MSRSTIILLLATTLFSGCNLFSATNQNDRTGDAGADVAASDANTARDGTSTARDGSTPDSATPDSSMPDGSMPDGSVPDSSTPDQGEDLADLCVPETDAEICAGFAATCGSLLLPATGSTRVEIEGESAPLNECGFSGDFVTLCNSTGTVNGTVSVAVAGMYRIELVAEADLLGAPAAIAELAIDDVVVAQLSVLADRGSALSYIIDLPLDVGDRAIRWRFANDGTFDGGDRNLYIDRFAVEGPLGGFVDSCGQPRDVDCGTCSGENVCGFDLPNVCGCACLLSDGSCAPLGPHATDPCLECGSASWFGVSGTCAGTGACGNNTCHVRSGLCDTRPMSCNRGECEVGTCVVDMCMYADEVDGTTCGVAGECNTGACGCPDGITVETKCGDNTDNDCDGLKNCDDPDCEGLTCQGQKVCTAGACL